MGEFWKDYAKRESERIESIKQKLQSGDMTETDSEDTILCPYCGYDDRDDRYAGEGEYEFTCSSCGKEYDCSIEVSISYSTSRKEEVNPTPDGMVQVWPEVEE